ncbi:MAG: hypothetical protein VYB67_01095 [Pseudomonadota bacterium]|nr:hypothetical protein [Pseudomonadota bacterium]MEC9458532.1 hypothetical protein [Pseudomonadota bacterium]
MKNLPNVNDIICKEIFDKTKNNIASLSTEMKIDNLSENFLKEIVIPLAVFFDKKKKDQPFLIGLTGGQGSGKTTLSEFVQLVLQAGLGRRTIGFSIDDIYKTRKEREEMAKSIHPLCKVRGVPGTHNVKLGLDTLNSLCKADSSSVTSIPIFSKPLDQHLPEEEWIKFKGKPDFIFFDGWCFGARPVTEENWKPPMNSLERDEDPEGIWSKWYNKELAGDYQVLFNKFDLMLMIKVPSMDHVFQSRWIQEKTLERTIKDPEIKKKIMTKEEVYKFVMHYERLTRYILEEVPNFADIVIERNEDFNFSFIKK